MKYPKILFTLLLFALATCVTLCGVKHANTSCDISAQDDSTWAQELSQRNPFANDTNYITPF